MPAAGWRRLHTYPVLESEVKTVNVGVRLDEMLLQKQITFEQVRSMIGNGWLLRSMGAWLMWILGSIMPREEGSLKYVSLLTPDQSDDSDEDVVAESAFEIAKEHTAEMLSIYVDSQSQ